MPLTDSQYIDLESQRLAGKLTNINNEVTAQNRASQLTDSYRKRYSNFLVVLVILIFAFIAYLGITKAQEQFPQAPGVIFDGMFLVVLLIVVYYVYYAVTDLAIRSNMNYDEIDLPPPKDDITVNIKEQNNKIQNTGVVTAQTPASGKVCIGAECCPDGTPNMYYDGTSCVLGTKPAKSTFVTIEESNKLLTTNNLAANVLSAQQPNTQLDYHLTRYHL